MGDNAVTAIPNITNTQADVDIPQVKTPREAAERLLAIADRHGL